MQATALFETTDRSMGDNLERQAMSDNMVVFVIEILESITVTRYV